MSLGIRGLYWCCCCCSCWQAFHLRLHSCAPVAHQSQTHTHTLKYHAYSKVLQSRPIKMRTPILYLANRWTKFKMLLTSNRFLYLIRFLLLSFPLIPQFIAQFRSICLFLCSSPYFLPVATKWELEQSMHCPLCHCCHSFLFSPSERTKWRSKKVLKSLS